MGLVGWTVNSCAPIPDANHPDQAPDVNYELTALKNDQFIGSIPAIDAIAEAKIGNTIHGGAIAIVCNGKVVYMKGYGNAHIDPDGSAPFTKNTVGAIGSVSKTLTAMAIMKLVEMTEVNLEATIDTYFDHAVPARWNEVTVRDLLSHKGGFDRHLQPFQNGNAGPLKPGFLSPEQVDASFGEDHASQHPRHAIWEFLLSEQGTPDPDAVAGMPYANSYSNLGYLVLGAIIDNVTRQNGFSEPAGYEPFTWSLLADAPDAPLTMALNQVWRQNDIPKLATGYASSGLPVTRDCGGVWCSGWEGPPGGWSMTIGDFARVALALMNNEVLDETSLAAMIQNQGNGYGLGLVRNIVGSGTYGHDGLIDGFRSRMAVWPDDDVAVVGFVNQDKQGVGSIVKDIGEWWINAKKNGTLPSINYSDEDRALMRSHSYRASRDHVPDIALVVREILRSEPKNSTPANIMETMRKKYGINESFLALFEESAPDKDAMAKSFLTMLEKDGHFGPYRPSLKVSNLCPEKKGRWAYSANTGWLNGIWSTDAPGGDKGVRVSHYHLGGHAWSGNFGWLDLGNCKPKNEIQYSNIGSDFGVNLDMATGNLSGFAYGGNIGWVAFDQGGKPRLDLITGCMEGYAWSPNCGWINLAPRKGSIGWKIKHFVPSPDQDNDKLPDPWELQRSGNLTSLSGQHDSDGDCRSDWAEYVSGTDPNDPSSFLALGLVQTAGGFDLSWSGQPGRFFTLFSSEDLQEWEIVPEVENMPGQLAPITIEVTPAEDQDRLFWKLKPSLPMTP